MKTGISSIMVFTLVMLAALALHTNIALGQGDSHWTFDQADVAGNTAKDVWTGKDGEIIGAAQIVNGKVGQGIELNGVDQNVKVSSLDMSPSVYPAITLMAWVYPTSDGAGGQGNRRFLFGQDDGGWDRGLLIEGAQWRLGTGNEYWNAGVDVQVGAWQHVAMVYDAADIKFYMNGVEYSYGSPGTLGDGNDFLLIGTHPTQARFFQGIIDEVYAYDSVMSELEIQQIMEGTIATSVNPGTKLSATWAEMKAVR